MYRRPQGVRHREMCLRWRFDLIVAEPRDNPEHCLGIAKHCRGGLCLKPLITRQPELLVHLAIHQLDIRDSLETCGFENPTKWTLRLFASDGEGAAHPHDMFAIHIEVYLAGEYHRARRKNSMRGHIDTYNPNRAVADLQLLDRVAAGIAIVPLAIVTEWVHGKHRATTIRVFPDTTSGSINPKQQRQPISVEGRDGPRVLQHAEC